MSTRILQISDLHIGRSVTEENNFKIIVNHIIRKGQGEWQSNKPVIMITGDIVNDGDVGQYETAKGYLDQLHAKGFNLRLIPGNHDYGKKGNLALEEGFIRFKGHFSQYHDNGMDYPYPDNIDGHCLIGLNSMQSEYGLDGILADGGVGEDQVEKTADLINEYRETSNGKVIVYLHHHPFLYPDELPLRRVGEAVGHWLKDGKEFMSTIKDLNIDVLLFGHEHRHLKFTNTILNDRYNIPYIISSGKSSEHSREFPVLQNGSADQPECEYKAFADLLEQYEYDNEERERVQRELDRIPKELYGRMIEINDAGDINITNEVFV